MTPEQLWDRILANIDTDEEVTIKVEGWPPEKLQQIRNKMRYLKFRHWKHNVLLPAYTLHAYHDRANQSITFRLAEGANVTNARAHAAIFPPIEETTNQ